jgi:SAM-dependent methyltransferase
MLPKIVECGLAERPDVTATTAAKMQREPLGKTHQECPICGSQQLEYEFVVDGAPVCGCEDCGLLFLNPQPGAVREREADKAAQSAEMHELFEANAAARIQQLVSYSGLCGGKLLIIGDEPYLAAEARRQGFDVFTAPSSALDFTSTPLDACILFCALEKMRDPLGALEAIRRVLKPDGSLMVVSPTTDSRAARLFKTSWWEFNRTNLFYFSIDALQNVLARAGFGDPMITADHSYVSLNYLRKRLGHTSRRLQRYRLLRGLTSLSPVLRNRAFRLVHSRTTFLVKPKPLFETPLLSVIVPVYNERATVVELLDQVLAKNIDGVDIEVIVVESNSSDGSRELVRAFESHPRVRLILEDRPRGKGFAVRTALAVAKGDVVLFQDADLEYDVNDYDALIAPILRYRSNFVMGSRHTETDSAWKIRTFVDSPALAAYFNLGHALLLTMFNVVYGQQLTDPFTMFKVFRRECLYGLSFECDRFDFDNEIVIKLIRKGYKPLELPVNYISRSMQDGKKVTLFLDPLRWIRALIKFRNSPLYR